MADAPIQFKPGPLREELESREHFPVGGANMVARRDLTRYYALLRDSIREVELTPGEAAYICDCLNGTIFGEHFYSLVWAEVADAEEDGLGEKWGVDAKALADRLRGASLGCRMAIVDAAERAWAVWGEDPTADLEETLRLVGLLQK